MTQAPEQNEAKKTPQKSARRRAREFAVQGLYQWQLTGDNVANIERFLRDNNTSFGRADEALFRELFYNAVRDVEILKAIYGPHLDREEAEVSPVERAILLVGTVELTQRLDTPYAVVINEAIEIAKTFGGTDGHRFVNGVLDKLAIAIRPEEVEAGRNKRR
ncbi:transcription antitermination factor NusB [Chitinimonas sp. BJYL2]|uniref:transcription antitermination factor NusB n=1 Tax=Chitinimonas sp. BJYL2 TaxID=2976696 RepID=UPI0022B2CDB8|nr:transcription antitermination factor NusB [Chitinimonas sp. BJYL2]